MLYKMKHLVVLLALLLCSTTKAQIPTGSMNIGIMLPLHNIDGDGRRMVEYYRGILLAIESLKNEGREINVHAWNVPIDADIRTTLLQEGAQNCNIIFGPLYSKQVANLSSFCKSYKIKMVIPFSITGNDVDDNSYIYQVYQSQDEMNALAIQHIVERFPGYHPVIIDCNDTNSQKGPFTSALRSILEKKKTPYGITNTNNSDEIFAKAFSLTQPNIVVINTGRSPELTTVLNKLDTLTENNKDVKISLFGYTEWLMYAKYNRNRFAKYDTYIPSNFYYNETSSKTKQFVERYRKSFRQNMMYSLPHFAITGYDHAMYFIGNRRQWLQSPLNFQKVSGGGYRNKAFMLIHYAHNGRIEAINY